MKIEYNGLCDKGLKREINQDAVFMGTEGSRALFVVADGMGGHSHGEKASRGVTEEFRQWWNSFHIEDYDGNFNAMVCSLRERIEFANQQIFKEYNQAGICGTTMVALFIYQNQYCIFSSGDSRIYHLRRWSMKQITVDDVWENQPEIKSSFRKSVLKAHPNYGKLLHAIGTKEKVILTVKTDVWLDGDRFLLCSDGLYKMCNFRDIKYFIKAYKGRRGGNSLMEEILQTVYERGAKDNVSVVLALCRE
ncbi:MAG: serine/threonine-protein phosphatase [Lachnospiraceae bacterium]|nr:serine/threonine-protein phosphatase [Lachnospiraceae bacterium]